MHHDLILTETVILFGTALLVSWVFRAVSAPSIIGFLFTGILIGPSGWSFIGENEVAPLAELGLVLLLFVVGLELSPRPLFRLGRNLLVATGLQVGLTALVAGLMLVLGARLTFLPATVLGVGVALSSTAIVLKQLSDRGETRTAGGVIITGILLLQDIIVISVMIFLPLVAGVASADAGPAMLKAAVGMAGLLIITALTYFMLPWVLTTTIRPGGREVMTLFAVFMACGGAWLAGMAGWSLALGSCIAGLLLAGTDVRHQLMADITPFRDVFNALFFISLGTTVNLSAVAPHSGYLAVAIVATLLVKAVVAAAAIRIAGWPVRIAMGAGVGLCTVSEFAYVLAIEAHKLGILTQEWLENLTAYAVGTMMCGSIAFPLAGRVADWGGRWVSGDADTGPDMGEDDEELLQQHVIVVGYGTNGQNLSRVLRATRIPHFVIEMNPKLVEAAREAGVKVLVGDATRTAILKHAGLETARALVVAINDVEATHRIVSQALHLRRDLYILARTSVADDIDVLYKLGAQVVIAEDFETSIEISAYVLKQFGIPDNIVEAQIAAVRAGRYGMLRGTPVDRVAQTELLKALEMTVTQTFYLESDSYACNRTIAEVNLRAITGVLLIAVVRGGKPTTNPPAEFRLLAGDVLVMVGAHAQLDAAKTLLTRLPGAP